MNWESERQLCDAFREWCERQSKHSIFPECFGWDMVLEDNDNRRLGIQAKLKDGLVAAAQCKERLNEQQVDAAAILIPAPNDGLRRLCKAEGFGLIEPIGLRGDYQLHGRQEFYMNLPIRPLQTRIGGRKPLPMTPSALPAGVPSPRSIKDGEFMLEVIMNGRGGYLTNKDFQRVGWPERFSPSWLWKLKGRPRWEPTLTAVLPSQLDPKAYAAMKRKLEKRGLARV